MHAERVDRDQHRHELHKRGRRRDPERRRAERKWNDPTVQREKHGFRPGGSRVHAWSAEAGSRRDIE